MKEWIPKKNQKYWIICILALLVSISFFQKSNQTINYEDELNNEFRGIVVKKFIDSSDHSICKLVLKSGKTISVWDNCYEKVAIGDSVVKNKANFDFLIYKSSGVVVVDIKDNLIIPKER